MAFLTLNGWTVPVVIGGEEKNNAIGFPMARSHTGTPLTDARAYKREWRFSTPPLTEMHARALIGLIQGRGFSFAYDSSDYAGNGLVSASGAVRTLRGLAADGSVTQDNNGTTYGKYGAATTGGDVSVEATTTNVLNSIATNGPNICTGTDSLATTGGFTAVNGATLATNTSNYWQGSRSVSVVTDGVGGDIEGIRTAFATVTANATCTASVYVKGTGNIIVRLIQNSGVPALVAASSTVALSATIWRRIEVSGTLTGGNTTTAIDVVEAVADSALTFYCDGFQIEERATATAWVAGTRAAGQLNYGTCLLGFDDLTINAWVQMDAANQSTIRMIAFLGNQGNEFIEVYRNASANNIIVNAGDSAAYGTITYASSPWDGGWHMVTAVLRHFPETGENGMQLYLDGTSVGTGTQDASYTGMESGSIAYVGYVTSAGNVPLNNGRVDGLTVVPYAAPAALITGWYGLNGHMDIPKIRLGGDLIPESSLTVIGEINNVTFRPHQNGAAWRNNGRVVDFSLYEVSFP